MDSASSSAEDDEIVFQAESAPPPPAPTFPYPGFSAPMMPYPYGAPQVPPQVMQPQYFPYMYPQTPGPPASYTYPQTAGPSAYYGRPAIPEKQPSTLRCKFTFKIYCAREKNSRYLIRKWFDLPKRDSALIEVVMRE